MDPRFKKLCSAVIKITNRCNIRCKYCYEEIVAKGTDMSSEVFQRTVRAMLSSTSSDSFLVILHGGEPTILTEAWFEQNLSRVRDLAEVYEKKVEITIQSNLIDVSNEKLRIFQRHSVSVGGSLDNPALVKGTQRPLADKALATYKRAREMGVRVGILSTINASNVHSMRDFCQWLADELGVRHFKANVAYPVGAGFDLAVPSAEDIFAAQRSIIEYMLDSRGAVVEDNLCWEIVRFFENYLGGKDRQGTLCDDKRCGAGSRVVGVTPNGRLLPCGRFAWSDNFHHLGNLDSSDQQDVAEFGEKVSWFHELNPENWRECAECEAASVCGFGCQAFIVRSRSQINIECEPTKLRFAYYLKNIDRLQSLYERFCATEGRPAMSRLDQKVSRLRKLVPPDHHQSVQRQLTRVLQLRLIEPQGDALVGGSQSTAANSP